MSKTEFVVVDENVLGCINPRTPNTIQILSSSVLRGAAVTALDGTINRPQRAERMRPATRKDFADFRVSSIGYEKDTANYNFPAEENEAMSNDTPQATMHEARIANLTRMADDYNLRQCIAELVRVADEITAEHWKKTGLTYAPPETHVANYISDKWCRIETVRNEFEDDRNQTGCRESDAGRCVYAFICLQDGETKALGKTKKGDIHKPESWKKPAKHARGNVFNPADEFRKCLTSHGVIYL